MHTRTYIYGVSFCTACSRLLFFVFTADVPAYYAHIHTAVVELYCVGVMALRAVQRMAAAPRMARSFTSTRLLRHSPNVQTVYDSILKLNLMETVELVNSLKEKFGYVETAMSAAPAAAAPTADAAAAAPAAVVVEKTEFSVRLKAFKAEDKIKVIKEVRQITGLGLKQAKDLVESAPEAIIKKDIPKDEANKIMEVLKGVGAELVLE